VNQTKQFSSSFFSCVSIETKKENHNSNKTSKSENAHKHVDKTRVTDNRPLLFFKTEKKEEV